jgi:hypothetical protein
VEVVDDFVGVDLPLSYLVLFVEVDVDAFRQDHLYVAVQVVHHRELERRGEDLLHQLADVLDLLLAVPVSTSDLHNCYFTFDPLESFYSLIRSAASSFLEE